jgi:iron(III) transport system substrate-binding protein
MRGFLVCAGKVDAKVYANVPDFKAIKFIKYDYTKYGQSSERKRLIEGWEKEVNSLPR